MMAPDQNSRPAVSSKMAAMLVTRLYGLVPDSVKELDSYDDRNFHVKVSLQHTNPYIKDVCSHGYILKVINSVESKTDHVEAEFAAQHHLVTHGMSCPLVAPSCEGRTYQRVHLPDYADATQTAETWGLLQKTTRVPGSFALHQVRLMEFVPGVPLKTVPYTPHLLTSAGAFLGRMHNSLQDFSNPHLTGGHPLWALDQVSAARPYLSAVTDSRRRHLAKTVIDTCHEILTNMPQLPQGTIHGDFSYANILVTRSDVTPCDVTGVLDFAHLAHSFYVYELGVSIMYLTVGSRDMAAMLVGGYFLAGYLQERHLSAPEWQLLKTCMCARYAQSLVIGAYHSACEPDNEYLGQTSVRGWEQLTDLWNTPQEQLYTTWCDVIRGCSTTRVELPY